MKKLLFIICIAILPMVMASCGSTTTPNPVTVLQNHYQALSSSDLDKAMSDVDDDAVFIDPMGKYVGKENIRDVFVSQMNIGAKWEVTNIKDTNGKGRLVYDLECFVNDALVCSGPWLTVVKDGKIIFDGSEGDWKGECDRDPSQSFCGD